MRFRNFTLGMIGACVVVGGGMANRPWSLGSWSHMGPASGRGLASGTASLKQASPSHNKNNNSSQPFTDPLRAIFYHEIIGRTDQTFWDVDSHFLQTLINWKQHITVIKNSLRFNLKPQKATIWLWGHSGYLILILFHVKKMLGC